MMILRLGQPLDFEQCYSSWHQVRLPYIGDSLLLMASVLLLEWNERHKNCIINSIISSNVDTNLQKYYI